MKNETMFVACGCHYSLISDFEEYAVVRNGLTEFVHLFRYQKKPTVTIDVFYYDNEGNYRLYEDQIPYENCRSEMVNVYKKVVNG